MSVQTIYKTKKIITVSPDETLAHALSILSSSHDAAFVFESDKKEKKIFLGLINPYYCVVKKNHPPQAKIRHCLIHPPKINIEDSIEHTAQLMIDSKIHYLPVFDPSTVRRSSLQAGSGQAASTRSAPSGQAASTVRRGSLQAGSGQGAFLGIITARRLIDYAVESGKTNVIISQILASKHPLVSVFENDSLARALSLFKTSKVSKLIVLKPDLHLAGIVSLYDMLPYLSVEKERLGAGSRVGNSTAQLHDPVRNIMHAHVMTLTSRNTLTDAAQMILDKEKGSVIIVDGENHPVGIITTRDILSLLTTEKPKKKMEFIPHNLVGYSQGIATQFAANINRYLTKFPDIVGSKFTLKERSVGGIFEAILSIFNRRGGPTVIKKEGKDLKKVLSEVKKTSKNAIRKE